MGLVTILPSLDRPAHPVVSVCIANFNGEKLLASCINSVLEQVTPFTVEIIVHDDASSDDSVVLLRREYPQAEVLVSSMNVGFCAANNRMVAHSRGQFVLLLNNDAALRADALTCLLRASREQAVGILSLPQYDWDSGDLVDRGCRLDPFYNPVPNLDPWRNEVAMVIGACLWLPREVWTRVGGFPEWLESIGEDLYLCCAARLAGLPVSALTDSGYLHRQGHTFGGNKPTSGKLASTFRRRRLSERNKTFTLLIMTPTVLVWPMLALHLLVLTAEGAILTVLKRDVRVWTEIYGNVFVALWRHRQRLRKERRRVQATRVVSFVRFFAAFTAVPRKMAMLLKYGIPQVER